MDFTFTEEQRAAAEAAKGVFASVAPDAVTSPTLAPGAVAEGWDTPLWTRLAKADLLGLPLRAPHGSGLDTIALCLVLRESSRVLARVPLLENSAAAVAVQRHAPSDPGDDLLQRVARGESVLTVASHGRTGHEPAELAVSARRNGARWVLDGIQTAVPWASDADVVLVPACAEDGRPVVALVDREQPGIELVEQVSTSGERLGELRLRSTEIATRDMLTGEGVWDDLRDLLTIGTCALALGLGERVLRMTGEYTGEREQFGHPLATFQAVAMQAADRYIDLRAMEVTLWQAAWRLDSATDGPLPTRADVAVAKIWAAEGVRRVVQTAQHLHGGFGADVDCVLHRYHAWAKHLELALGPSSAHEEVLGDLLAAHPVAIH
ncbi:acyl-CoA dehydrogenase family protein [Streptomyces sp. WMMC905]|uniref:acyl-CoA dehydrogenase family protein n=1 Tax=Streptomyces sp. WMMC905 TaxID=3404123 RepID=UPI003B9449F6